MVPFLSLEKGDWWLARCTGRDKELMIKGSKTDVVKFEIYGTGAIADGLPGDQKTIEPMLKRTPTPVLTGANKAIVEALYFDAAGKPAEPKGKLFLIAFSGKKEIAGGRSFNQWDIYEIPGF
jgi:hypothetical protein